LDSGLGGGLLGWIRRELVERRAWVDDTQFLVYYGLSQMVPGATNVNLSVILGSQLRGVAGALTAVAATTAAPRPIRQPRRNIVLTVLIIVSVYICELSLAGCLMLVPTRAVDRRH